METKEKYYTPEIEEFHEGFEFELITIDNSKFVKKIASKYDVSLPLNPVRNEIAKVDLPEICWEIWVKSKKVRVKYLDKEDVESLGWSLFEIFGRNQSESPYTITKKGQCFYLWMTHDYISINVGFIGSFVKDSSQIFRGKIKNKSELKRLMRQLEISTR